MLVRQAHEIEFVRKNGTAKSPFEYQEKISNICITKQLHFCGFIGDWKGNLTKIKLKCNNHNHFFETSIATFNRSSCCYVCQKDKQNNKLRLNNDVVIRNIEDTATKRGDCEFVGIDGDYKNAHERNLIVCCHIHGNYKTSYESFVRRGSGCPLCKGKRITDTNLHDSSDILNKAIKTANNKKHLTVIGFLDDLYLGVDKTKLKVECCHHGIFYPNVKSFIRGSGCPACAGNVKRTNEDVIKEAKKFGLNILGIDGGYKNFHTRNIIVECDLHGKYKTSLASISKGCVCINCASFGYQTKRLGRFYIQTLTIDKRLLAIKFGITNRKISDRVKQQSRLSKFDHEIFYELILQDGQKILELENKIKEAMKGKTSYISKEDMPDGYTETVAPSELSTIMYIVKSFEKELTA